MWNILLFFLTVVVDFSLLLLAYRKFGRTGVFAWIPLVTVLANLQVQEIVPLFGFTATLGNAAYASLYLATDILSENHSRRDAHDAVLLGFFSLLAMILISQMTLLFHPAAEDTARPLLYGLFRWMPRLAFASLAAYLISQFLDVALYHFWKHRLPALRWLWLRNNFSTILCQGIDTLLFVGIAFYGKYPPAIFWSIAGTTYLLKIIAALLDTPFIYLARKLRPAAEP